MVIFKRNLFFNNNINLEQIYQIFLFFCCCSFSFTQFNYIIIISLKLKIIPEMNYIDLRNVFKNHLS